MIDTIGAKALMPNPALEPLTFLIGTWRTTGTHPLLPGETLHGRTSFQWHEGGAFLIMRSQVEGPQFPDGVAIFGSDNGAGKITMIYFDERGISRVFDVTVGDGEVAWRRDDPNFAQSLTIREEGGNRLVGKGLMSERNGPWSDDLSQIFDRE